jgi:hypothetical protein
VCGASARVVRRSFDVVGGLTYACVCGFVRCLLAAIMASPAPAGTPSPAPAAASSSKSTKLSTKAAEFKPSAKSAPFVPKVRVLQSHNSTTFG